MASSSRASTRQAEAKAVIAAWVAAQRAALAAGEAADPETPALLATTTGGQLAHLESIMGRWHAGGYHLTLAGPFNLGHPMVTFSRTHPNLAVVRSCVQGDWLLVSDATGKPVAGPAGTPTMDGGEDVMELIAGRWFWSGSYPGKTFPYDGGHGSCGAGY